MTEPVHAGQAGPPVAIPASFAEWHRLHPASPVVKGWQPVVFILALRLQNVGSEQPLWVTGAMLGGTAAAVGVYYWLAWRVSRYRLEGADLVVENGVLFKRSRRVPLARLQAVDVVRPLLARALGLAELKLEVAGGKSSDASLAYLEESAAHSVRNDLLALAAGLRDDVLVEPAPEVAPEEVIATVPLPTRLAATLLNGPAPILVLIVAGSVVFGIVTGEFAAALAITTSTVFGIGGQVWAEFARGYGTTIADSPDGLRIRRGLIETRSQTVPPGRVQGVRLYEPFVWRLIGWAQLSATVAGYAGGSEQQRSTSVLPVAPVALARALIHRVLPGVDWEHAALTGVPARARWRAPIESRRLAAGAGDTGATRVFVTVRGRFGSRTDVVPLARVQSVRLVQGPLQRRLRLATVHADLSSGPVKARALHRDERDARALVDSLVTEARVARAEAQPDRWLRQPAKELT